MLGTKPLVVGLYHEHYFKGLRPPPAEKKTKTRGVSHCPLVNYIKKIS